jgi:hypothetical protein
LPYNRPVWHRDEECPYTLTNSNNCLLMLADLFSSLLMADRYLIGDPEFAVVDAFD